MSNVTKAEAIGILWHKGVLVWKLSTAQKDLYQCYIDAKYKTIVWSCSRRLGKSYALCLIAIETCLKKPNSIVKYVAPQQKMVKTIIRPLMREILRDCPDEIRPDFRSNENIYRFTNGSEIQLAGTDAGHAESLRGGSADVCIVDEAGFVDDLSYVVQSILIPTTTTTRGRIILSSTPPKSPGHAFTEYLKEAEYRGSYVKKTIFENPLFTKEMIDEILEEYGGQENVEFRREYMCEPIVDEETAVVPEFTEALQKEVVKEWKRPAIFDIYTAGDVGFVDLTVMLFAYYDFRAAKLIIEDELVMSGPKMTTQALAQSIKQKEGSLWLHPVTKEAQAPYLRVCDNNNLILINDLNVMHGLTFQPAQKDNAAAALNNMRIMLAQQRVIIHPRCTTLIYHLKNAIWNKSRKTYERSPDAGHYDAVDALKYLIRHVQYGKNPYPSNFGAGSGDNWWEGYNKTTTLPPIAEKVKDIFKVRRGFRR